MNFLAIFGLVALAEMATFFWVESRIGLAWALGIAIATALIGSVLVRRVGLAVWARLRARLGQGEVPGRELSDGAAVLVSGAFLISPGFITDALGFLLLIPAVRGQVYRWVSRRFSGRVTTFVSGTSARSWGGATIVDADSSSEIIDVDPED
ncbi:MAG: FxsA family protein [Acidimicrobiia bacterium]|nr:FxsA family protein [Acidimicrobiia bacterium]MDH3463048.1 FxsA family protein [Acidimicrobiia bacterium]